MKNIFILFVSLLSANFLFAQESNEAFPMHHHGENYFFDGTSWSAKNTHPEKGNFAMLDRITDSSFRLIFMNMTILKQIGNIQYYIQAKGYKVTAGWGNNDELEISTKGGYQQLKTDIAAIFQKYKL